MEAAQFLAMGSVLVALLVPLTFVSVRESVKRQRQEIVRDLQAIFDLPNKNSTGELIPSFEFVKYKYFLDRDASGDSDASIPEDYKQYHWLLGAIPLVITCSLFNYFLFGVILHYGAGLALPLIGSVGKHGVAIPLTYLVVVTSYVGSALFTLKAFFRAISNFDLSPLSFIGAWVNLLFSVSIAVVFVFGLLRMSQAALPWDESAPLVQATILLTAFVVGQLPNIANRNLLRAVRLKSYKHEDTAVYKSFTAIPIEIIDGIDSEIRDKLNDFHINSVQNLAAANPIMLFVETPYGVYQIMDWVAQAELCCSVGSSSLLRLWRLGVRTIFDLERAAFDPLCRDEVLLSVIGQILLSETDGPGTLWSKTASDGLPKLTTNTISADVIVRIDNPHVHRLRQLFMKVAERIGQDSRRLPPLTTCAAPNDAGCLLAGLRRAARARDCQSQNEAVATSGSEADFTTATNGETTPHVANGAA